MNNKSNFNNNNYSKKIILSQLVIKPVIKKHILKPILEIVQIKIVSHKFKYRFKIKVFSIKLNNNNFMQRQIINNIQAIKMKINIPLNKIYSIAEIKCLLIHLKQMKISPGQEINNITIINKILPVLI
jgi:hypothetical protein